MKKIKLFIVIIICFLVVGCGNKSVTKTCKIQSDQSSNGYKSNTTYTIYSKDDIVMKVEQKEIIDSNKKDILDFYKNEYNSMYKKYNKTYGGYTYDVSVKDDQLILNVTIDYNKFDMNKYINDNTGIKKYVNDKNRYTLDGIVSMYKNMGGTCK
ncbi:MAG: DUF1307 domain-containing protein [Bacilli bacterium]|nr:DUF1307 domain-containing protein [Bacilli bacterium]